MLTVANPGGKRGTKFHSVFHLKISTRIYWAPIYQKHSVPAGMEQGEKTSTYIGY